MASSSAFKKLLTTYLRRLTNLSGINKALFLPRLTADQFIDVHSLSQLNKEKSFSIIESLIAEKRKIVCSVIDSRLNSSNEASKKLKKLERMDQFIFEERGSNDLQIGWPFVKGKFMDGRNIRCPLLFVPVELIIENNNWIIKPRSDGGVVFNKSFLLAYSFFNKVKLAESLLDEDFENIERDSTVFRTEVYKMLQQAQLEVNFNADNFRDELISFEAYSKLEFEDSFDNGSLKLFPEAVLGIFPQAGSYLVPDYQTLLQDENTADLEEFFYNRSNKLIVNQSNFISLIKEEKVYPVFAMDIWQENALKAVKSGNSIVVEGPPGTGKSHLICNLIADAIANKLRVLVVCQKRVALDVVYRRLEEKGLSSFLGLVHDFKEDRKEVYEKITKQIDSIEEYKQKNNTIDAIHLERKFYTVSRRIDQLTEELEDFRNTLFNANECGLSVRDLYLRTSFLKPYINLKQEFSHFRFDHVDVFLDKLKVYCHYAQQFLNDDYVWKDRKSLHSFTQPDLETIKFYLDEIPTQITLTQNKLKELLRIEIHWTDLLSFSSYSNEVKEWQALIESQEHYKLFKNILEQSEEEVNGLWLSNIERLITDCYIEEGPEVSVESIKLGAFQEILYKCLESRKNLFAFIQWRFFSKDRLLLNRVLVANNLKNDRNGLEQLELKLDRRLNLEHNLSKLKAIPWLNNIPQNYSLVELRHWFQLQQRIIRAKDLFNSIRSIKAYINPTNLTFDDCLGRMHLLFTEADNLNVKKAIWSIYFTENQIQLFTNEAISINAKSILTRDFNSLVEFDSQRQSLDNTEIGIIEKLVDNAKTWDYSRLKEVFLNSLGLSWIDYLEKKYPILNACSSGKIELLENQLRDLIAEKTSMSNEILLLRARENVVDNLTFNRLNNRITYRDLLHQVTKKRKVWPLRKLIQEHAQEIARLLPCWLSSPETVSAIFPMQQLFDLIIFDEASQCFIERGIPSMYRGKQIIIAGDSQQLKPNDIYQPRWSDEENEFPDAEIDSLLDVSKRYLTQVDLRHHYRSQSIALINFSNQYFYKDRLTLLPDRTVANNPQPAIEYKLINGTWENQTNLQEAQVIVNLLVSMLNDQPQLSVGVITFNAPQQNLIQDIFEDKKQELGLNSNRSVFIKNIENVQGDESDVILFSIGYAPNNAGKVIAQFGSLNQQGGENRLNVAITRAKRKIVIVTSILPDQLHVDDTLNPGPKILKAYLHYAHFISSNNFIPETKNEPTDNHSLKKVIEGWCEENHPSSLAKATIPTADVTIQKNKLLEGLLFTDDEAYRNSLSSKDRHALLPVLIEQRNWRYLSLYSRNYWKDPERFSNELSKFITHS